MTLPTAPDDELLDRYLVNECAPDEREMIQAWTASKRVAVRLAVLRRAAADPFGPVTFGTFTQRRRRFWDAVDAAEHKEAPVSLVTTAEPYVTRMKRIGTGPWNRSRGVWSAAGVALAVVVMVVGWRARIFRTGVRSTVAVSTYVTANGERATITLPDGNTVALDVGSRLEVPMDYVAGDHTLRLTGKGLFTVLHHHDAAFTVMAGKEAVHVLGTSFVVRRYAMDSATTVAVRDGKVAVRSQVLVANQQVEIGEGSMLRVRTADAAQFSFVSGVLMLNGMLLPDAIPELNRWYDADIRIGDPVLMNQRLAGEVPAGSLAELASLLEWTFHMRVVREGRILTLFPR